MPKVVIARSAGFCFGVRRAVEMVETARRTLDGPITTLGPIIHNAQVAARHREAGISMATDLSEVSSGTVVFSAHGVSPSLKQEAEARGLEVIDVCCPFVEKLHRIVEQMCTEGYHIILVGDAGHTEVVGTLGAIEAAGGRAMVVSSVAQLKTLRVPRKVGLVAQTTQHPQLLSDIAAELIPQCAEVRVYNTICNATHELQESARLLAESVDMVVVVGGRNSANTRRLYEICASKGIPAYHIETADEIDDVWIQDAQIVGVTAGASTPDDLIDAVIRRLSQGAVTLETVERWPQKG